LTFWTAAGADLTFWTAAGADLIFWTIFSSTFFCTLVSFFLILTGEELPKEMDEVPPGGAWTRVDDRATDDDGGYAKALMVNFLSWTSNLAFTHIDEDL
jgi:hypothetical protein